MSHPMPNSLPKITHVAIKFKGVTYARPAPERHHHVIRLIAEKNGVGIDGPDEQGFMDENGRFYSRIAAMQLAKDNGQLKRRDGGYQGHELFSEDLW